MTNAAVNVPAISGEFAELVSTHLDELITYAAHLVGDADSAVEMAAAGIFTLPSTRPPTCASTAAPPSTVPLPPAAPGIAPAAGPRAGPPLASFTAALRGGVPRRRRRRPDEHGQAFPDDLPFERRSALLLRNLGQLSYVEVGRVLECSPDPPPASWPAPGVSSAPSTARSPYEVQPAHPEQLPDGELDAARRAEVEAHLVGCDRCRAGLSTSARRPSASARWAATTSPMAPFPDSSSSSA